MSSPAYDPFARGPHPVGVRTGQLHDAERGRSVPVEVWYPAADAHAGEDLDDATRDRYQLLAALPSTAQDAVRDAAPRAGRHPAVVFSHGFGGHRRQSTFLCTHLASHGYLVVAPDHVGNTTLDVLQMAGSLGGEGGLPSAGDVLGPPTAYRPSDASLALDWLADQWEEHLDPERVGAAGHSFGGWTTLALAGRDARVRAALPLAPAGGAPAAEDDPLPALLDLAWEREVPTLYLVAERDSLLPLAGMHRLLERTPAPRRMAVLRGADHQHFCDEVERIHEFMRSMLGLAPPFLRERLPAMPPAAELCPGRHGNDFTRGLGLAHLDAHLRGSEQAAAFLESGAGPALAARGIEAELVEGPGAGRGARGV